MSQEKLVRAVYPDGTHLDVSRTTSGALRGTVRDNGTTDAGAVSVRGGAELGVRLLRLFV